MITPYGQKTQPNFLCPINKEYIRKRAGNLDHLISCSFSGMIAPFVGWNIGSLYEFHFAAMAYRAFGVIRDD